MPFGAELFDALLPRQHLLRLRQRDGTFALAAATLDMAQLAIDEEASLPYLAGSLFVTPLKPLVAVLDSSSFSILPGLSGSGQSSVASFGGGEPLLLLSAAAQETNRKGASKTPLRRHKFAYARNDILPPGGVNRPGNPWEGSPGPPPLVLWCVLNMENPHVLSGQT